MRVSSQRSFAPLVHHDTASRPDLLVEVYGPPREDFEESARPVDVVMIESKIGSGEGHEQLKRYAEHLDAMVGFGGRALLYVTRAYDPKDEGDVRGGVGDNVRFKQLRWQDFYRFLHERAEKDALVEEVMTFMEEQGMATSYRFSATDLAALSGIPRAFELMEETLSGKVKAELEAFTGSKSNHETVNAMLRSNVRYVVQAPVRGWDLSCYLGYRLRTSEDYPLAYVTLHLRSGGAGREASLAALRRIAGSNGWEGSGLEESEPWARVLRTMSLAKVLPKEDHVAAVKEFFVESVRQLGEELAAFKKPLPEPPREIGKLTRK